MSGKRVLQPKGAGKFLLVLTELRQWQDRQEEHSQRLWVHKIPRQVKLGKELGYGTPPSITWE